MFVEWSWAKIKRLVPLYKFSFRANPPLLAYLGKRERFKALDSPTGFGFNLFFRFQLSTMNGTGGGRWTQAQSDLLKATYLVTYDEEMRPNWDWVEERYNVAALHYDFPKRTNIDLRKRWSRLQANDSQHDPNRVAKYASLVRRLMNSQMLNSSTTTLLVHNAAKGQVEIEESLEVVGTY